jgi:DNA-binding SARP family transcriptional activator
MATGVRFGLLGPLEMSRGAVVVPVGSGKQRALLAALLLNANHVVATDELAEVLWGAAQPAHARVTLQNYVLRLRKAIAPVGGSRITTVAPGYVIRVDADELDVSRFEALQAQARHAARDGAWDQAAVTLRQALSLWRGQPLADVPSELLAQRELPRLSELRLQAIEARLEADLRLGGHAEVIGELRQLVGAHPLRERLHGLLMLALYRDGQQADALAAYRAARGVLVGELGAEPGPELRRLQRQILNAEPALYVGPGFAVPLAVSADPSGPGGARPPQPQHRDLAVPRQLPGVIAQFTGRDAELATLDRLLAERSAAGGPVVISAIGGTAGVGKTALAVHWAHGVAERFPDGQLYVDLRGYAVGQPIPAAEALAGFIRALGLPGSDVPADAGERAALFRSLLAGRRLLILLDNARHAEQARPLLPGTAGCAVVVTSRDALAGLLARDGATRLDLDLLPAGEAVSLLRVLIGPRVDDDAEAATTLAAQCARLPLALRIAAELAAARPGVPLTGLVAELDDHQQRLDLLDAGGDPDTAIRAVFSWSYRHLDTAAAQAFRQLGSHPGVDFDYWAVAALNADSARQARHVLDQLVRAHLIQPGPPGRYGMHDLLRAYARDLNADQDSARDRRAAVTRLYDYYLQAATAAMNVAYPTERHHRPSLPAPVQAIPPAETAIGARAWLDAERINLIAVASDAVGRGLPGHATTLAATISRYLDEGGHYDDSLAIHASALHAGHLRSDDTAQADSLREIGRSAWRHGSYQQASGYFAKALDLYQRAGDELGQAMTLGNLGVASYSEGRYTDAAGYHRRALVTYRRLDDQLGQARSVDNLALTLSRLGHYRDAYRHHWRSLDLFRSIGDRTGEAGALDNLGVLSRQQGRYQQSVNYHRRSLAQFRELGHRIGEALALDNLGRALGHQGEYAEAADHHQSALALFREIGSRDGEAGALDNLGRALRRQGRHQEAVDHHQEALALYRELGNRPGEAEALNGLGEALAAAGDHEQARARLQDALALALQIGDRREQARAREALATAWIAAGGLAQARDHWQHALTIYTDLRVPDADRVRAALDSLGPP